LANGLINSCEFFTASFEALDPEGDEVVYSSPSLPEGATLTQVGSTATLEWTPTQEQFGQFVLLVYATDQGSPPQSSYLLYYIQVIPPPLFGVEAPLEVYAVGGQSDFATSVGTSPHPCYQLTVEGLPPWAIFHHALKRLEWSPAPEDFGVYDATFTLTDQLGNLATAATRFLVSFVGAFDSYAGYQEHFENLDFCCFGDITRSVVNDNGSVVLRTSSELGVDVHAHSYRTFTRSAVPLAGANVIFSARDVVVGPACGSGGALAVLDFAVTDPDATWPNFNAQPTPAFSFGVLDGSTYTEIAADGFFVAPVTELTLTLEHYDNSNICTVDVFWSGLLFSPIPAF
jgi:hypothetical protein